MDPRGDAELRIRAFQFLDDLKKTHGSALPRELLETGFEYLGQRVPLIGASGIWKPAAADLPISFTTVAVKEGRPRPYEDSIRPDGLISYRYRGTDPTHRDNRGLRIAMQLRIPLIYFVGLVPGRYAAEYPVFIVGDDPSTLSFAAAVDDRLVSADPTSSDVSDDFASARRLYVTTTAQRRVHQQSFRERVLRAYRECCAICNLKHPELLDAAHILADGHPKGEPWVSNGLALCKLHHAAFDLNILGINPSLVIEIREDILREVDGPMLKHGLQELDGKHLIYVPKGRELQPNEEFLSERYAEFKRAG